MSLSLSGSALFGAAAESLPLAVVIADRDGRVVYVNPAAVALLELGDEDPLGGDVMQWVAEEDRERCHVLRHRLLDGEPVDDALILRLRREDGSCFPAELTLSPLHDETGVVVGTVSLARDVTERLATEADAARLRGIVGAAAEAILGVDIEGTILFFSPSAERLFGWPAEEIVGQSGDLLVSPTHRLGAPALFAALEAKGLLRRETVAMRRDRTPFEVEVSSAPIRDATGVITGAAITVLDVSDRRRDQRLLDRIIENAPNVIAVKDLDGRYLLYNRRDSALEWTGQTDFDLFSEEVATRSAEQDRAVLERGAPITFRDDWTLPNGETRSYVTTKFPLLGPQAKPVAIGLISSDVTELRRAEVDQAHLAALVEAAPDAIIARDEHGRIVTWNPGAETVFQLTADAVIGRSYADLVVPESERASFEATVAEVQAGRTLTVRAVRRRGDGTLFPAQVSTAPLTLLDGTWRGTLTMIRDITDLVEAELELRERAAQLERSNAELERFAYAASHDLQEPLHSIKLSAGAVSQAAEDRLDADERELLSHIDEAASRLSGQIRGLMEVARVALGEAPGERVLVSVAIRDAVQALRAAAVEANAEVIIDEPLPAFEVPRSEVALVLQNLISNAIKYRRPEERACVRITAEADGDEVRVRVTDNGVGLDESDLIRVFGLFERGPTAAPGTGLGLAIARRMLERLGGALDAQSPGPGQGSMFTLHLPRAR